MIKSVKKRDGRIVEYDISKIETAITRAMLSLGYGEMVKHLTDVNAVTVNDRRTTYHGYGKVDNAHIDYCFINDKIKPISLKIIDETVDGMYPTDHYGLFIKLDI